VEPTRKSRDRDYGAKGPEWRITVTRNGQIRIPAELMTKYRIRESGMIQVVEASAGLMLRPIPRMEDRAGADAGKHSYAEMVEELDNLRKKWR
jgi:bifunctional DNA-binding transcriptional regulator/antitoxin component of YhaV-PrlF toxin-antitoxin module